MCEDKFTQICVWPACSLGEHSGSEFEAFMMEQFKVRIKFLESVKTLPDLDDNGNHVPGTGDRDDLFFGIHTDDIGKFALPRLTCEIRWWEDVMASHNNSAHLYPEEIIQKYHNTWDASIPDYNGPEDLNELMDNIADAQDLVRSN